MAGPTVSGLSDPFANFMIPPGPKGPTRCSRCWEPCNPAYGSCYACNNTYNALDVVVPITYSLAHGQMHQVLRGYKDDPSERNRIRWMMGLAAVLTRYSRRHEATIAAAAGLASAQFDVVAIVPSSKPDREGLRWIVETGCSPLRDRFEAVLEPTSLALTGEKIWSRDRYRSTRRLDGESVLLIDDTWTRGYSAQSAAVRLQLEGASNVALLVIGRHIRLDWEPDPANRETNEQIFKKPPKWDWDYCAI